MTKIWSIIAWVLLSYIVFVVSWTAHAQRSITAHDCALVTSIDEITNMNGIDEITRIRWLRPYVSYIPENSLQQAAINLKSYCCEVWLPTDENSRLWCQTDIPEKKYYPESQFLFDHFVDVVLRYYDGVEANNYDLAVDPQAQEWAEKTIEWSLATEGVVPKEIDQEFRKYRELQPNELLTTTNLGCSAIQTKVMNQSQTWSLSTKILNSCAIAACMYESVWSASQAISRTRASLDSCNQLAENIFAQQSLYIENIMIQQANRLLQKQMTDYITDYFSQKRLNNVQNTIANIADALNAVNKLVIEGTKQCSG